MRRNEISKERSDLRGQHYTTQGFFSIFRRTIGRIQMFFSIKLSSPQVESSLNFSAHECSQLANKQTNRQTDKLTEILLL